MVKESSFINAPLVTSLDGQVVDRAGRGVAGARVRTGNQEALSNRCGRFGLRRVPAPTAAVRVEADGFAPARVTADGLVPGRGRQLPLIVLERPR